MLCSHFLTDAEKCGSFKTGCVTDIISVLPCNAHPIYVISNKPELFDSVSAFNTEYFQGLSDKCS